MGDFLAALIAIANIIKVAITQHAIAANPAIGPIPAPFGIFEKIISKRVQFLGKGKAN
jgi:hypothetical protein